MAARAQPSKDVLKILSERILVEQALREAALQTLREHKEEGLPLAMWRDGRVVWMSAEEVEAEMDDAPSKASGEGEP
jgi:CubicO group peptidase (beta-lactamase class C family)